jgi:hypothetical protein
MSQSGAAHRPDLGAIIAALHDSQINGEVSWFFDGVWRVKLGDAANGFDAEAVVASPQEAAKWLPRMPSGSIPPADSRKSFRGRRATLFREGDCRERRPQIRCERGLPLVALPFK